MRFLLAIFLAVRSAGFGVVSREVCGDVSGEVTGDASGVGSGENTTL